MTRPLSRGISSLPPDLSPPTTSARRVPSTRNDFAEWGYFCLWLGVGDNWFIGPHHEIHLKIGGGELVAKPGDWIIKDGERVSVCPHDEFMTTIGNENPNTPSHH
jgi:hypothetical protein